MISPVDFNNEWVKSISKDEFVAHCADNFAVYGWSELDAIAYYNTVNPTAAAEKPTSKKASKATDTTTENVE
jgi:hypothetical protein